MSPQERNEMLKLISDLSKAATGSRLRYDYAGMSDEELQQTWDYYIREVEASELRDADAHARNWDNYVAYINEMCSDHLIDRPTAIRWDMQAENIEEYDIGFYAYQKGLSSKQEADIKQMMARDSEQHYADLK